MANPPPAGQMYQLLESSTPDLMIGNRALDAKVLREFYQRHDYRLMWSGEAESRGDRMLMDVQSLALSEGLVPDAYAVPATASDIERDLLISDALLRFGRDLAQGRIIPSKAFGGFGPETRPNFDGTAMLAALADGKGLIASIRTLPPPYAGYLRLKVALERYRTIVRDGGWSPIADGPALRLGDADQRVAILRGHLIAGGDLSPAFKDGDIFDAQVVEALKRFQVRHGLDADGAMGRLTLAALNVPAKRRLRQIEANLERWRWMPRKMAPVHVAVNLASARLELVVDGEVSMAMRAVVGDVKHQTPTMATTMSSLVLNPPWTVPPSIANREILPKLRKDPNYLVSNNMRILDAFPEDDPAARGLGTDWSQLRGRFPFRLRQQPGPDNALGLVKFNLKESDDIYLHDTPKRQLFGQSYRALSHGCVRVERPLDLAEALLGEDWRGKLIPAIEDPSTRTLRLARETSVYLMYWTAWTDGNGVVHFRDDVYGHDGRLLAALSRLTPGSPQIAEKK